MAISGMVVGRKKPSAPRAISTSLPVSCGAEIVDPVLRRGTNAELRTREYLTPAEIEELIKAAKDGRWGHRDATLILVAYRHGLRAKEACELEWSQVEFGRSACLHVRRAKNGKPSVHPILIMQIGEHFAQFLRFGRHVYRQLAVWKTSRFTS